MTFSLDSNTASVAGIAATVFGQKAEGSHDVQGNGQPKSLMKLCQRAIISTLVLGVLIAGGKYELYCMWKSVAF